MVRDHWTDGEVLDARVIGTGEREGAKAEVDVATLQSKNVSLEVSTDLLTVETDLTPRDAVALGNELIDAALEGDGLARYPGERTDN